MRTYIFTEKERKAVSGFLRGSVPRDNPTLMVVLSRIKSFRTLASDIELYINLGKTKTATAT